MQTVGWYYGELETSLIKVAEYSNIETQYWLKPYSKLCPQDIIQLITQEKNEIIMQHKFPDIT